jgi:hypothetical protein
VVVEIVEEDSPYLHVLAMKENQRAAVDRLQKAVPSEREQLRALLGDLVRWPDPSDDRDAWVEAEAPRLRQALQGNPPLSQIIINERSE